MTSMPLAWLGRALLALGYRFVTVTPETHRRVLARAAKHGASRARNLVDVFGWSKPFDRGILPEPIFALLKEADALHEDADGFRSAVRFSSLGPHLFAHSAYPTTDVDAVFFGPDTYRFAALLEREVRSARRAVDIGCGSGAGAIVLGRRATKMVFADVNAQALHFARTNANLAKVTNGEFVSSDVLAAVEGTIDLVVSNPPYLVDGDARAYRDGGGTFGCDLSLRIVREALERLEPGGRLVMYTGAAIVAGKDTFQHVVAPVLEDAGARFTYTELDPDVFGEELESPAYADVDRIAAVALVATKPL